jgi:multidrug efflux pump subunit AcrA (membrane-fusion protein)
MFFAKLKTGGAVVLALMLSGGAGAFAFYGAARAAYSHVSSTALTISDPGEQPVPARAPQPLPVTRTIRVPSQVDGVLLGIFTPFTSNDKVAARDVIVVGKQKYRRLREGDKVKEGQLLARVNDALARDDVAIAEAKVTAAEAELKATTAMKEESKRRLAILDAIKSKRPPGVYSDEDISDARVTIERYTLEETLRKANVSVVQRQLRQAQTQLKMYEISSPADGVIKTIYFRKGEAVKRLETVLEILPNDDDR